MSRNEKINKFVKKLLNYEILTPQEVYYLCLETTKEFMKEPNMLKLSPPLSLVGDVHGQFGDLIEIFRVAGFPPFVNYLFLGDYVDRGQYGIETICLLFCFKILYPNKFYLIRGNHECRTTTATYGFYTECIRKYNQRSDYSAERKLQPENLNVWENITYVFDFIPISALIEMKVNDENLNSLKKKEKEEEKKSSKILEKTNIKENDIYKDGSEDGEELEVKAKVNPELHVSPKFFKYKKFLAIHAGISPLAPTLDHIRSQFRFSEIPKEGLLSDLMWSDPETQIDGFNESPRGAGYLFGKDVVECFLERNKLDGIIRAHQLCQKGYSFLFNKKVITVWSAPNYCRRTKNRASVLEIDENMGMHINLFDEAPEKNFIADIW